MNVARCPLCLEPDAAMVRIDRRGRPYLKCRWCESRCFLGNPSGLTTVLLAQPALARIVAEGGGSRALQQRAEQAFAATTSAATARSA
ncbi:MAG: hypothetical protein RLZZ299_1434 [Pseudomonadota bacterium]|jgi:hypothetical protein